MTTSPQASNSNNPRALRAQAEAEAQARVEAETRAAEAAQAQAEALEAAKKAAEMLAQLEREKEKPSEVPASAEERPAVESRPAEGTFVEEKPAGKGYAEESAKDSAEEPATADAPKTPRRRVADSKRTPKEDKPKKKPLPVAKIVIASVVAVFVACAVAFSAFRWFVPNDAADFQGTWYIAGTDTPITITEEAIQLTDDVSYHYVLNPDAKTVGFSFSTMQGGGHYRFSLDRQQLAIMDGTYGWWDTLFDDLGWTLNALVSAIQGKPLSPAEGENVTHLVRTPATVSDAVPDEAVATESSASSQAEAA